MSQLDREEFTMDVVRAINEVAEEHGATDVDKLALISAIGDEAAKGNWYSVPDGGSE